MTRYGGITTCATAPYPPHLWLLMASLSYNDINLGQLALARGHISLAALIQATHQASVQKQSLSTYLESHRLIDPDTLHTLMLDVQCEDVDVQAELAEGNTLMLEQVHQTSSSLLRSHVENDAPLLEATLAVLPEMSQPVSAQVSHTRYELLRILGKGGMGHVWLAHDHILNREVALKVLRPDDQEFLKLFEQQLRLEAQITGLLEHPSIIPVYDLGQLPEKGMYYTMRVVREESLEKRLSQMREAQEDQELSLTQLIGIVKTTLLALQYAHDHGIIHRDLKPENILIGKYGEVFVIDWGVAKVTQRSKNSSLQRFSPTKTKRGTLIGTPHYMAPEQALGENERVDERTDIYAMGVILYEILTLKKVFDAGHVLALLLKIAEEQPVSPSIRAPHRRIPDELEEICLRALQKNPEDRYQSAQDMAHELDLFLEGVKEQERHAQLAQDFLTQATHHRSAYQEAQRELRTASSELQSLQKELPSWASIKEKEPIWKREQDVEELSLVMERHFGEALRCYGQVLGYVPNHGEARRGMAELYWQRFLRAEQSGDEANAIYFEGLVRQYNDGQYNTLLAGLATLSATSNITHTTYTLYRYEKGLHRLRAIYQDSSSAPLVNQRLPHGSYLLTVEAPGHIPLRVPLLLKRLGIYSLTLQLLEQHKLPSDLVVITEGDFLSGDVQNQRREDCTTHLNRYAIMRHPVTCQQYVDFLNGLAQEGALEEAYQRTPRVRDDASSYFEYDEARGFYIPETDQDGTSWDPDWPIVLITYHDAEAYAKWRSKQDGIPYHIPTAAQLEKAARGVDGRIFVWGNDFDPSFCRMRESEQGRPFPTSIHTYPIDCSPYGVMQLNGNVAEWSSTWASEEEQTKVMRGGSYSSSSQGCRLDWPLSSPSNFRYSSYGFRLAVNLPEH